MSAPRATLQAQFAQLIAWERRKRLEQTALATAGMALALAIVLLPLPGYLPLEGLRWLMPLLLMLLIAPWFFHRWRWRRQDATRSLVNLDKALNLAERATTAWELSAHEATSAVHELVFKQAQEQLHGLAARRLFPRQWDWPSYAAAPLLALWLALLWFDVDRSLVGQDSRAPASLAHKVGEFSRELQEKAKSEGLRESLKAGQELEQLARNNLETKSSEEQLKRELAGMAKKLEAAAKSGDKDSFSAGESQQSLQDLKAELEAARDLFNFPDAAKASQALAQQWMDRLASLPQLKRQLDKGALAGPGFGPNEMKSLLDRLEQQASGELDRRTLLDAQQFLEQMPKSGQARRDEKDARTAGRSEQDGADDGVKEKNHSNLPGKEPGKKDHGGVPEFRGGAQTQVKGQLGDGDSNAVGFKGKPTTGKSALGQQEVAANYRRQAEQELNSERVPEALKETIRNYFLSLENSGPRK
ncbi:MAG: hypothetical protein ACREPG_11940 [Candidatus Binatia bacterium]